MIKAELRTKMKMVELDNSTKLIYDKAINDFLEKLLFNYEKIAVFKALEYEVNIDQTIDRYINKKNIYLPVAKKKLRFYKYSLDTKLIRSNYNVMEPTCSTEISINDLEVIVIPSLAINKKGYRLGHGAGYYDKALKDFKGLKIGVIYSYGFINDEYQENHDMKFDIVITEKEIIRM